MYKIVSFLEKSVIFPQIYGVSRFAEGLVNQPQKNQISTAICKFSLIFLPLLILIETQIKFAVRFGSPF